MTQYIDKSALVAEIKKTEKLSKDKAKNAVDTYFKIHFDGWATACRSILSYLETLEVIDPYELCVQYPSIKDAIQAHAETYSFNIESELFHQLTREQQELWRKEIEQAVISGGDAGYSLAKDKRYKENLEVKEVDLDKETTEFVQTKEFVESKESPVLLIAKHFYELGLTQKGE